MPADMEDGGVGVGQSLCKQCKHLNLDTGRCPFTGYIMAGLRVEGCDDCVLKVRREAVENIKAGFTGIIDLWKEAP